MARMYCKGKGRARSMNPYVRPEFLSFDRREAVTKEIRSLASSGISPSQIGMILRDYQGVGHVKAQIGISITKVLRDSNLLASQPEEHAALCLKAAIIRNHMSAYSNDKDAKYRLILTESHIHRLTRWMKQNGKLSIKYEYNPENVQTN